MKQDNESRSPKAEDPAELSELKRSEPEDIAAGFEAVYESFKHALKEGGMIRAGKALLNLNQKGGFDCPSCAWPDPDDDRSAIAEYCESGAKAVAEEITTKSLKADFFAGNSVYDLSLLDDYEIGKKGRIAQPMYLPEGATHYQPISWDDAFKTIAGHLNRAADPNQAIFYTSGRTSNEAAFVYQLFVRQYGTNNLPDCSNMCHESTSVALKKQCGLGKASIKLDDLYQAEVIIIIGQNPGTNAPRMLSALRKGRENGAKIIAINPMRETGLIGFSDPQNVKSALHLNTKVSDLYLKPKINTDQALLKALLKKLWDEEQNAPGTVFDHDFISNYTTGYDELMAAVAGYDADDLLAYTGITQAEMHELVEMVKNKSKIIFCWAMGVTQHKNAVNTIYDIMNILLLKGSIGKPGAGSCPVRGHSNVQGDRTMGIWEKPEKAMLDKLQSIYGFDPPREEGYDVVKAIKAMHEGKAKIFFAMGGNFLSATPDTTYSAKALRQCDLTVHVSTKLNRSHLVHGKEALILPCLSRSDKDIHDGMEHFVSTEGTTGVVQSSKGVLEPVSEHLLSEVQIICRLAKATFGPSSVVNWDAFEKNYDTIRDDIEKVVKGFENYNQRVRVKGGFYLPNGPRERKFDTEAGKAYLIVTPFEKRTMNAGELIMMTIRSHDQFNTTIYGLKDRYRGVGNERRVIFMNLKNMEQQGLRKDDVVDIYNHHNGVERVARQFIVVDHDIAEGCVATYFPETNVLVPIDQTADESDQPASKSVIVTLKKTVRNDRK
ncbi:FdhF/YdeP family oxidoreductase [Mucilaginibacter daejeonensis]|uniref:FdhF/YdeP family oxidoreductase n=1 Tax=Mucilaginibacter daejeonensis TaxID=398049 RepID=UPI001D173AD4|nr:FdhF/YdeP family oxidoreductase [Mucilaginibacter daejeonensis]UEG54796.1 FdhF/YdeP family oxidoreductase [Mucilaginibacter daejeonensis]